MKRFLFLFILVQNTAFSFGIELGEKGAIRGACLSHKDKKLKAECKEIIKGAEYQKQSVPFCVVLLKTDEEKSRCLQNLKGKIFSPNVFPVCGLLKTPSAKLDCLLSKESISIDEYRAIEISSDLEKIYQKYADIYSPEQVDRALSILTGDSLKLLMCKAKVKEAEFDHAVQERLFRNQDNAREIKDRLDRIMRSSPK